MFTLPPETGERIKQALAQRVCTAADGSYIRRSFGRRRTGRSAKYTVHMAQGRSFVVTAPCDGAAVAMANKRAAQQKKGATTSELIESDDLDGYKNAVGNDIDWNVATRTPCPLCGGACEHVAMKNDKGSCRAFAIRQRCQAAHEF